MAAQPETQQSELFEETAAVARERMGGADLEAALSFIALYYAGASPEDLIERRPDDLYGAAVAHLNLARRRAPGRPKVRAYNPQVEQHGWQSTHTIVEIVTDDMPFLVDSVRMVLNGRGYTSHLVIHPVMRVRRSGNGDIDAVLAVEGPDGEGTAVEALIHIETDRQTEPAVLDSIAEDMLSVLGDVRAAVEDWGGMRERMRRSIEELDALPPLAGCGDSGEVKAFLEWIEDNHFTFLGYCSSRLERACGAARLVPEPETGLGLLRAEGAAMAQPAPDPVGSRPVELLAITRADARSRVHRPSHLDCIAIRRFDADGNLAGEHRFVGLYTSEAFNRVPLDIPLLRQKAEDLQRRAGYPPNSHAAKALQNIVDTFPRELLFQIPAEELFETATGILHLQERQRIRLFVHPDRFGRFYSCIVFVPRDRFTTRSRLVIQDILEEAFGATDTEFTVRLSESVLARLFFVMRVDGGQAPQYDLAELESRLRVVSRTWTDDLHDAPARPFRRGAGDEPLPALWRGVPRGLPRNLLRAGRRARCREDGAHPRERHRDEPLPTARSRGRAAALQALPARPAAGRAVGRAPDAGEYGPQGRGRASQQDQADRCAQGVAARFRDAARGRPGIRPGPHRGAIPRRLRPRLVGGGRE